MCSFYGECNQTKIQMYNQAAAEEAGAEFYFGTTAEYIIMENGAVAGLGGLRRRRLRENHLQGRRLRLRRHGRATPT